MSSLPLNSQQPLYKNKKHTSRRSVFSCRQHWKSPSKDRKEVNKTFTFHCCYPCCEYLSCYWNKNWIQNFHLVGIVSIPSRTSLLNLRWWCKKKNKICHILPLQKPHTLSLNHRGKLRGKYERNFKDFSLILGVHSRSHESNGIPFHNKSCYLEKFRERFSTRDVLYVHGYHSKYVENCHVCCLQCLMV